VPVRNRKTWSSGGGYLSDGGHEEGKMRARAWRVLELLETLH